MKRFFLMTGILILLAAGCRSTDSIEQLQSGRRSDCDVVTILAPSNNELTRTTLSKDETSGKYNIFWAIGDEIGVFSSHSKNADFILKEESGDNVAFKGFLSGEPTCAYYPYSSSAGNNPESISMNLPDEQTQQTQTDNIIPNMSYDLKSGQLDAGNTGSGYTFTFQQKLTLLRFTINPGILLDDDVLQSITLTAPSNRKLTGDYTLDITNADAVPSFGNNASNSVTVNFKEPIPISDAVGYAFINPDILKGDALDITINTDKHIISTFTATSGANFVIGKIYEIGIDLAELESARKVEILQKDSWNNMNIPGYYILSNEDGAIPIHQYHAGIDQYAWSSSENGYSFRIQSMKKGRLSMMTITSPNVEVNGTTDLTLYTIYGNDGAVEKTYPSCILKKEESSADKTTLWLQSQDGTKGFIIWKVNLVAEEE